MCFIKSSPKVPAVVKQEPVKRHTADASQTKMKDTDNGYRENIRTSVIGLTDDIETKKKTLLGE